MSRQSENRRRAGSSAKSNSDWLGWVLGGVGVLFLAIVAGFGIHENLTARSIDPSTECPQDHLDSVTVVLVDLTDQINPVQAAALKNALQKIRDGIPQYGRLEIYPLTSTQKSAIQPLFAACNPGSAAAASNPLTTNATLQERIWKKGFADKLDQTLTRLEQLPQSDQSPIFEALQSIAVTGFGTPLAQAARGKTLVVVSDMLHYTSELSMYQGAPEFSNFRATRYYLRIKPDFRDANVDVYLIVRETRKNAQQPPLYKFWNDFVASGSGYLRNWEPLQ